MLQLRYTGPTNQPTTEAERASYEATVPVKALAAIGVGSFVFLGMCLCCFILVCRPRFSENIKQKRKLNLLPIHKALIAKEETDLITLIIRANPGTIAMEDHFGDTAFDLATKGKFDNDVYFELMHQLLPYDPITKVS
jgi:hypothetical protein